ncbi:MAG: hypothetical protein KAT32_04370 [Candidatus Moranbacteria bacterium]|nr:hypothetical protein [Candidatus Moranbacteria bacterium]
MSVYLSIKRNSPDRKLVSERMNVYGSKSQKGDLVCFQELVEAIEKCCQSNKGFLFKYLVINKEISGWFYGYISTQHEQDIGQEISLKFVGVVTREQDTGVALYKRN